MFGYVVVNKSELKFKEFDEYRAYYCGLCNILEQKYNLSGKMTLSYDMTFLYLLLSGLYEPPEKRCQRFCPIHPLQRCNIAVNPISEYVADMNVILAYYKAQDDWQDERKINKRIFTWRMQKKVEQLKKKYPLKMEHIKNLIDKNTMYEQAKEENLDEMARITGEIMGEIYAYRHDEWESLLRQMGFFIGKFIYIMDAWDDLDEDEKNHRYNVLHYYKKQSRFDEWCGQVMVLMMSECTRAFEMLPILKNVELMRNILYGGVWNQYKQKMSEKKEGEKNESV